MRLEKIVILFAVLSLGVVNAQSAFPNDSLKKYDSIIAVSRSYGKCEKSAELNKQAEAVLDRAFKSGTKVSIDCVYSKLYKVMDDSKDNFYVSFMENGRMIVLWFRKKAEDPSFISDNALISKIENTKEGTPLHLEIQTISGGAGKVNAFEPKRTTYSLADGSKSIFVHAKLLSVTAK
jgi:hypothetical protein